MGRMVARDAWQQASTQSLGGIAAVLRRLERRVLALEKTSPLQHGQGDLAAGGSGMAAGGEHRLVADQACMFVGSANELYHLAGRFGAVPMAAPGMVQRTLRRMHIRLWHAPAQRLRDLLSAAGLPTEVLNMVQDVVDTCTVCRTWVNRCQRA